MELVGTMFDGQFGVARSIAGEKLPPVYSYAVETAIQLTLTELNENLREIYIEAYSLPTTAEYIYKNTTAELKKIFGANFTDYTDRDFYETEIGTSGLMLSELFCFSVKESLVLKVININAPLRCTKRGVCA